MKLLAMQSRLIITETKRLALQAEFIFDDGTTLFKVIDANTPSIFHVEDLIKEAENKSAEG